MTGMDRLTGAPLDGAAHIQQSVADILATPIGSVVGLRDYGSLLRDLVDQPLNPANILRLYAATAVALARWENRIRLRQVTLQTGDRQGAAILALDMDRLDLPASNSRSRLTLSFPLT